MNNYRIAVEPDNTTYRLVRLVGLWGVVVVRPRWEWMQQVHCSGFEDVLRLENYEDIQYAPDYDYSPYPRF